MIIYRWGFIPTIVSQNEVTYLTENSVNGFGRMSPPDTCIKFEFPYSECEDEVVEAINKTIINFKELSIDTFAVSEYSEERSTNFDITVIKGAFFSSDLLNRMKAEEAEK